MPLIILSGFPTSGKSTRAKQLHDYMAERISEQAQGGAAAAAAAGGVPKYRLHLISDDGLSISRAVYDLSPAALPAHTRSANASEKDARAALYAAVKRVLSPRDIVILDGLNYIKGWRYQLACEAKNVRTMSAVLQIGCGVDKARAVNEERLRRRGEATAATEATEATAAAEEAEEAAATTLTEPYEPSNWENLVYRYEEPNGMARWDSPLFALTWDDDAAQTRAVFDKLWDTVAGEGRKREIRPNMVALQRGNDGGGDYLYILDRETQDIVRRILDSGGDGDEVRISRSSDAAAANGSNDMLVVELPSGKRVGLPQLQRLRRAFLALNRGGIGLENAGKLAGPRIRESFVGYLNDAFEKDG